MKVILLLMLSVVMSFSQTQEFISTGYGTTFSSAKKDAIRNAVEQASGIKLKSKSLVLNGLLEEDKISSSTDGLISSYEIIDTKKDEDGDYEVKLKVLIDSDSTGMKNIEKFIEDKKSMRMFTKENFNNRSVMVLYSTRNMKQALDKDQEAAQAMIDDIQDALVEKSFDVKLKASLSDTVLSKTKGITDQDAIVYGKLANSDVVVLGTITVNIRIKEDGYSMVKAHAMLKAYDTTSGRLLANISEKASTMIETSGSAESEGYTKAAKKAANKSVNVLVKKLVERMSIGSNQFVFLTFKDTDIDTQDTILDLLEEKRMEFKVEKQYGDIMKVKINSDESASEFRRMFRKWLKQSKINLKPVMTQGSEIIYTSTRGNK